MANIHDDPREDQLMSDRLFTKIIAELSQCGYSNRISFYSNNEPTLDSRLADFVARARTAIPRAYLEIKSNGKGLNSDKVVSFFNAGIDTFYINDYTQDGEHSNNIKKIKIELEGSRRFGGHFDGTENLFYKRLIIFKRQVDQILGARAGTAPNKAPPIKPLQQLCFRPYEMMTISPNGVVGVCTDDLLFASKMGDINQQTITEIWQSERYKEYRKHLIVGERGALTPCSQCDYGGYSLESLAEAGIVTRKLMTRQRFRSFLVGLTVIKNRPKYKPSDP
ncbi:SPASM domain-containing protein [Gammaproteobacteria bacterium]|nr:SPASM domain-containing protein [Gammaproteobacteria bacterium]